MLRILKQYYPARNAVFVIGESIMIFVAVLLASTLLLGLEWLSFNVVLSRKAIFIAVVFQASLYYNDLYDLSTITSFGELGNRMLRAMGFATIIVGVFYYIFPDIIIAKGVFMTSALFVMVLVVLWRFAYNMVLERGWFNQNIIILGSGKISQNIIEEIRKRRDCGYRISLIVQETGKAETSDAFGTKVVNLSDCGSLCDTARALDIKKIVVALSDKRRSFPIRELLSCRTEGISILEGQSFYEMLAGKLIVDQINPSWLIFREGFKKTKKRLFFKRLRDIVLSLGLLIVFMPVILVSMLLIKIGPPGPVFSIRQRVGENKKLFKVYRFRITTADAAEGQPADMDRPNPSVVTRIGAVMRALHIDALPQLWNVLKGDMSVIGPRPEDEGAAGRLEKAIPYYGAKFTLKPGITGWAQVNCPYGSSVEDAAEMLNYDLFYIKNVSFLMDMMIIMRTIKLVLFGQNRRSSPW